MRVYGKLTKEELDFVLNKSVGKKRKHIYVMPKKQDAFEFDIGFNDEDILYVCEFDIPLLSLIMKKRIVKGKKNKKIVCYKIKLKKIDKKQLFDCELDRSNLYDVIDDNLPPFSFVEPEINKEKIQEAQKIVESLPNKNKENENESELEEELELKKNF